MSSDYVLLSNGGFIAADELYHHGIKGMKWGIRRYQNPDGSLTSAGKKRYSDDEITSVGKENRNVNNTETSGKGIIQKRKDKLTQHYISKGYEPNAAKTMAEQRIRTEAVLAIVGTVAVTAVAIKVSRRIGQDYLDRTFKAGKVIQNIGSDKNANFKGTHFFAAVNKADKRTYGMNYPSEKHMMDMARGINKLPDYDGIYNNSIKLTDNVRRASVANARKIFYDQMDKDPEFKANVISAFSNTPFKNDAAIQDYLQTGKRSKKLYDRFNQALVTSEFKNAGINKKYYGEMKKHGYNAILDINDTRYSGYKKVAKSPTIFFGDDKWEKLSSRKLSDEEIYKNAYKFAIENQINKSVKEAAIYGGGITGIKAVKNQRIVKKYLDEHPNSKLSREEILKLNKKKNKNAK